ncbi:3-hydroxyacyl-ACP dehydratase FabZ family protein [Nocardia sp. IFM 10818]
MILSGKALRCVLPHRPPMLLVDQVDLDLAERTAVGHKSITAVEPCYGRCESTGGIAYPPGLVLESMLQTCAALWVSLRRVEVAEAGDPTLLFGKAERVRFLGSARPGQVLCHHIAIAKQIGGVAFMSGRTTCDGELMVVAESLVGATGRPRPDRSA